MSNTDIKTRTNTAFITQAISEADIESLIESNFSTSQTDRRSLSKNGVPYSEALQLQSTSSYLVDAELNPRTTEIVFKNTTELVQFIDGLDGCGLVTTDLDAVAAGIRARCFAE